jgi:glycerate 2-kinase
MPVRFDRSVLRDGFGRSDALGLLEAAFAAVDPARRLRSAVSRDGDRLLVLGQACSIGDRRTWVVAIGKAGVPMARTMANILNEALAGGIAIVPYGYGGDTGAIRLFEAGHPIPDANGRNAATAVETLAASLGGKDLVLCLLSGGGSALLASPPPGVSLADLAETTRLLHLCGAAIDDVNVVRRHLSTLQGGQLARRLHPATVVTLILSDVVSGRPESVASGPTVPDPTRFRDALAVLRRHRLWDKVPASVRAYIDRGIEGAVPETAKPSDEGFRDRIVGTIGGNETFVDAICRDGEANGFDVRRLGEPLTGEARDVGRRLGRRSVRWARRGGRRVLLVGGGETTVIVRGPGIGGRNQEVALAAALEIAGERGVCVAAVATDGTDGPTEAAGAIVDANTIARAKELGHDPVLALEQNDAFPLLADVGDLLVTGPTRTNVADVCLVLIERA